MARAMLVPLDGSPLAERALPYAEALARKTGAPLALVRAVPFLARPATDEPYPTLAEARDAAAREARDYLDGVAARLTARGVAAETAVPYADEAEGIIEEARRRGADPIVMATHGRGGLGRWVYGSVAEAVLARTPVPLLLVRAWAPEGAAALAGDRPLLLAPLDGSPFAEAALPVAEGLADRLGGDLLLLRAVLRPGPDFGPGWFAAPLLRDEPAADEGAARDYLRRVAEGFARRGRTVQTELRAGAPAEVIAAIGRERGAALAVMATRGYTGAERALLGSVADATLRHGSLPLLLVRPPAPDPPATAG